MVDRTARGYRAAVNEEIDIKRSSLGMQGLGVRIRTDGT